MNTYHYTYLITNLQPTTDERYYIGVHSGKINPEDDTGYMGSSEYLDEAIENEGIHNFEKIIIERWESRDRAVAHEIWLHAEYNVKINPLFYNKCNALSTGFSTGGNLAVIIKHKETKSDPLWKETVGKEQARKISEVRSDPIWKETVGKEAKQKQKDTVSNSVWQETNGAIRKEKERKTKSDPKWKATTGTEMYIKRTELRMSEDWAVNRKNMIIKQKETVNDPKWKATTGLKMCLNMRKVKADLGWKERNTHICSECGKSIIGKGNLNQHLRKHNK